MVVFLLLSSILCYMFVQVSPIDGHVGFFWLFPDTNNINIHVQVFQWTRSLISLWRISRSPALEPHGSWAVHSARPQAAPPFYVPASNVWDVQLSSSSPACGRVTCSVAAILIDVFHLHSCDCVSWRWPSLHAYVPSLYSLLIFIPIPNQTYCLFTVAFWEVFICSRCYWYRCVVPKHIPTTPRPTL